MKLKIVGDPAQVALKLGTNRPLALGQFLNCGSDADMRKFAAENPGLVETVFDSSPPIKPEKNKMLKKTKATKAKVK